MLKRDTSVSSTSTGRLGFARDPLYERTGKVTEIVREVCARLLDITRLPGQVCLSLATFGGFSRRLLSLSLSRLFGFCHSRVANAPRKLRYHQLCSPASLPTEWTQSGSLSSESSFRWSLSYVHSLTDRIIVTPHVQSSRSTSLSRISTHLNVEHCYCFCQTRYVISPYY